MSRVIRISDETYARLQQMAEPLSDRPADVIDRLLDAATFAGSAREQALNDETARLREILSTPKYQPFLDAVASEAAHQSWRQHEFRDDLKTPRDWFWLLTYLTSKAANAHEDGDSLKALHHTISSSAVLYHWHSALTSEYGPPPVPDGPHQPQEQED